jgi:hypothetical protein
MNFPLPDPPSHIQAFEFDLEGKKVWIDTAWVPLNVIDDRTLAWFDGNEVCKQDATKDCLQGTLDRLTGEGSGRRILTVKHKGNRAWMDSIYTNCKPAQAKF